ncbi:MAG: WD40 repeat domain-containing protein [Gemmataceae bacterium]
MPSRIIFATCLGILVTPVLADSVDRSGDPLPAGVIARLGTIRFTHAGSLDQVAFSGDGKTIVFVGRDNVVGRWDASSGKELSRVQLQRSSIRGSILSGDGAVLVTPSPSQGLFVWDTTTGKEMHRLPLQVANPVLVWLKDGQTLLATDATGVVRIYDVAAGHEKSRWAAGTERYVALGASPDGKRLVTVTDAGIVAVRDSETGREIRKLDTVAARPRGRLAASGIVFSADGKIALVAQSGLALAAWDVDTGKPVERFQAIPAGTRIFAAAFAPQGRVVAIADSTGVVRLWDLAHPGGPATLDAVALPRFLRFSPDGRRLAGCGFGPALELWDVATRQPVRPNAGHRAAVGHVAFLDRGRVATAGTDGLLAAWDAKDGRLLDSTRMRRGSIDALAVPRPGEVLTSLAGGDLRRWRPGDKEPTGMQNDHGAAYRRAITADGRLMASWDEEGGVRITEPGSAKEVCKIRPGTDELRLLQLSTDGSLLATMSSDEADSLRLWKTTTGRPYRALSMANQDEGGVRTVAFSPTMRTAVTISDAGQVRIWELANTTVRRLIPSEEIGGPFAAAFTPDGRGLVLGTGTGHLRYIDVISGVSSKSWEGHRGSVMGLTFSPDGKLLVSGSTDTTALVWDVAKLRPAVEPRTVSAADAERCWRDLADKDGPPAGMAVGTLASAPAVALPLLKEKLRPPRLPPRQQLDGWIADLDSARFPVREQATKALAESGEDVAGILLAARPRAGAEARRRIDALLEAADARPTAAKLQALRGLEVIELIATPDARQLLESLSALTEDTWLKREARATLDRLRRRD